MSPLSGGPSKWDNEDMRLRVNKVVAEEEFFDGHGRFRLSRAVEIERKIDHLAVVCAQQKVQIADLEVKIEALKDGKGVSWGRKPGGLKKARGQ